MSQTSGTTPTLRPRTRWPEALALLLILLSLATRARAQDGTPRLSYQYTFGQQLTLALHLPQPQEKVKLYLRLSDGRTRVYTLPAQETRVMYERDLRLEPLEPFSRVTAWWEYTDAWGIPQRTSELQFFYVDNRFDWQQLQEGNLIVYWVNGDQNLMLYALDVARKAQNDLERTLQPPPLTEPLRIYVYPSVEELQSALRLAGREWVVAEAHPAVGAALLAISPSPTAQQDMEMLIPHELTHVQLYRLVGADAYPNLPIWFREGLASNFEQRADPTYRLALQQAQQRQTWIPLTEMCKTFGGATDRITLAYAQSQSVVAYIRQTYGWTGIRLMIEAYKDGLGCSAGVERALGKDLLALEREWRLWMEQAGRPLSPATVFFSAFGQIMRAAAPWLLIVLLLSLPTLLNAFFRHH